MLRCLESLVSIGNIMWCGLRLTAKSHVVLASTVSLKLRPQSTHQLQTRHIGQLWHTPENVRGVRALENELPGEHWNGRMLPRPDLALNGSC